MEKMEILEEVCCDEYYENREDDSFLVLESVLKELLKSKGRVDKIDNGTSPLVLAYSIQDKSFFVALLDQYGDNLKLLPASLLQPLLESVVKDSEWSILMKMLDKCDIDRSKDSFFVQLSLSIIRKDKVDIFRKVVGKFFPENALINNEESFLTYVIKSGVEESCIMKLVASRGFDVNLPNSHEETPLILVCQKLMLDAVRELLLCGSDVTYRDTSVVTVIMDASRSCSKEDSPKVQAILKLLIDPKINQEVANHNVSFPFEDELDVPPTGSKKVIIDIIKFLVAHHGDVSRVDNNCDSILSLAYKLPDKRIFSMLVENSEGKLSLMDNESGQCLLTIIICNNHVELLAKVLNKCEINESGDDFLLSLALTMLKQEGSDIYKMILEKCSNRNKNLQNGEVFLTNLFKEQVSAKLIVKVVKLRLFDLNVRNDLFETPLIIASERLMVEVVDVLLQHGSDVSLENYKAIEVAIKTSEISPEGIIAKNKIMDQFFARVGSQNSQNIQTQDKESDSDSDQQEYWNEDFGIQYSVLSYYLTTTIPQRRSTKTSFLEMFIFALFSKMDYLDYLFHSNPNYPETDSNNKELKDFLWLNIVYMLRRNGFVTGNNICEFVGMIKRKGTIPLLKEKEMDIEDVTMLFSKLFPDTNLLSFDKSFSDTSFYLSLVVQISKPLLAISIQDLLNVYMLQHNKMFAKIPAFLILQVPRYGKKVLNFKVVIPSNTIEISNSFLHGYKKCIFCTEEATYGCHKCVEDNRFKAECGFACEIHRCSHGDCKSLPSSPVKSKSPVQMSLQSVICYERDYFVAYTKHHNQDNKWLSFRSCNGSRIPTVSFNERISQFFHRSDAEMKSAIFGMIPSYLRQILSDSYIFMYQNSTNTCY